VGMKLMYIDNRGSISCARCHSYSYDPMKNKEKSLKINARHGNNLHGNSKS